MSNTNYDRYRSRIRNEVRAHFDAHPEWRESDGPEATLLRAHAEAIREELIAAETSGHENEFYCGLCGWVPITEYAEHNH